MARLAHKFDCPILSNDSDFLIYNLPSGFIMFDSFKYSKKLKRHKMIKNRRSIRCRLYSQFRLMRFLPDLQAETLPLLSVLGYYQVLSKN